MDTVDKNGCSICRKDEGALVDLKKLDLIAFRLKRDKDTKTCVHEDVKNIGAIEPKICASCLLKALTSRVRVYGIITWVIPLFALIPYVIFMGVAKEKGKDVEYLIMTLVTMASAFFMMRMFFSKSVKMAEKYRDELSRFFRSCNHKAIEIFCEDKELVEQLRSNSMLVHNEIVKKLLELNQSLRDYQKKTGIEYKLVPSYEAD